MFIKNNWRILTVGDGDLSFSNSLVNTYSTSEVVATIYDSEWTLRSKYISHALDDLTAKNVSVRFEFDVTNEASWRSLSNKKFDVVIFQFPLLPAFNDHKSYINKAYSLNILNRILLRKFIVLANKYALDTSGPMLCYITSKDVKPYCQWDLENSLMNKTEIHFIGQSEFKIKQFPGYKVRNVDRDKHVKETSGVTYAWSKKSNHLLGSHFILPVHMGANYCSTCRTGPFKTAKDLAAHNHSKKHKMMSKLNAEWERYVAVQG